MNNKILSIVDSPVIGLQYLAYRLSILLNDKHALPWFYSNFIQLQWNSNLQPHLTFFMLYEHDFGDPYIQQQILKQQVLEKDFLLINNIDLHKFVVNNINNDWYIYTTVDEFYVPHRWCYRQEHFIHDILIYGYDLVTKEYSILGYNENQIFRTTKMNFDLLENAINYAKPIGNQIMLFKRVNNISYEFDLKLVYDMLKEYLYSKKSSERLKMFQNEDKIKVYGIQVYDYLIKYFELLAKDEIDYDIRLLHILWEHKKCMVARIKYMINNEFIDNNVYLYDSFKYIENQIHILRNLQIKCGLSWNKSIIENIMKRLDEVKIFEQKIIEILLEEICKRLQNI